MSLTNEIRKIQTQIENALAPRQQSLSGLTSGQWVIVACVAGAAYFLYKGIKEA